MRPVEDPEPVRINPFLRVVPTAFLRCVEVRGDDANEFERSPAMENRGDAFEGDAEAACPSSPVSLHNGRGIDEHPVQIEQNGSTAE